MTVFVTVFVFCDEIAMILEIHDQGNSQKCWAHAISTMLRTSLKLLLKDLERRGAFDGENSGHRAKCDAILRDKKFHQHIVNGLTMVISPIRRTTVKMIFKPGVTLTELHVH